MFTLALTHKLLGVKKAPSYDTISRVYIHTDWNFLTKHLHDWVECNYPGHLKRYQEKKFIHIDGKAIKSSAEKGKGEKRDDKLHRDGSLRPHSGELPWHQAEPLEHRGTALASGCAAGRRPSKAETGQFKAELHRIQETSSGDGQDCRPSEMDRQQVHNPLPEQVRRHGGFDIRDGKSGKKGLIPFL